jgi:hypothetical protein
MASASTSSAKPQEDLSRLVTVSSLSGAGDARSLCTELESGNILYFPQIPFSFSATDLEFLLSRKQTDSSVHKNIAYRPSEDRITGLDKADSEGAERLRGIMCWYSQTSTDFLSRFLSPYAGKYSLDFASYRPIEEKGRPARLRARNDLVHVDAFPTRPTNGDRILRFFTNINPLQNRIWLTSRTFPSIAPHFAQSLGLTNSRSGSGVSRSWKKLAAMLGLASGKRSPYDEFMHSCHNAMKEDAEFQQSCVKQRVEFPPSSSWMVFTDCVSHAVLEGQYALEQTFIVSRTAMVEPAKAPVSILESLVGRQLTLS